MTWAEAKNIVAKKYGFKDWATWYSLRVLPFSESHYKEVADVYKNGK